MRYMYGLDEHLNKKMSVVLVGIDGVEEDELTRGDLNISKDLEITVTGGSLQLNLTRY